MNLRSGGSRSSHCVIAVAAVQVVVAVGFVAWLSVIRFCGRDREASCKCRPFAITIVQLESHSWDSRLASAAVRPFTIEVVLDLYKKHFNPATLYEKKPS